MPQKNNKDNSNPLVQLVRNLFSMFLITADSYPITYYKKGRRFRSY